MNIKNQPLASDPFHLGKCSDIPKKSKQVLQLYILFKLPFFNLMLYSTSDFESRVCTFKKSEQEYDSRRFAYFLKACEGILKPCMCLLPCVLYFITKKFFGNQEEKFHNLYNVGLFFKLHMISVWLNN